MNSLHSLSTGRARARRYSIVLAPLALSRGDVSSNSLRSFSHWITLLGLVDHEGEQLETDTAIVFLTHNLPYNPPLSALTL